ncbi:hypothetical protein PDE_06382 [Penicillium oxalicum 114-2]|uniref:Uncharacterized protein n=1 Tax=Penicillium oxalicum (strain 114-2 / CGMCC 5302) TaxID=933388 RepID=S8B9H3_PENO1|nr:hypothetical protein PDE_06382 [Penicillium oxalicum 114-2]
MFKWSARESLNIPSIYVGIFSSLKHSFAFHDQPYLILCLASAEADRSRSLIGRGLGRNAAIEHINPPRSH